jgi:broad specificity phosphatase PhoE
LDVPTVLLVRHGQSGRYDTSDPALSALGVRQAQAVARSLTEQGIAPSASSSGTLLRQQQTRAELPGAATPPDPRWDEYDVLALLTAYPPPVVVSDPRSDPRGFQDGLDRALLAWMTEGADGPGTWRALRSRVDAALSELTGSLAGGEVAVVVSSGGPIAAVCAGLLGLQAAGTVALHRVLANAAVTRLMVGRAGIRLASMNEQAHLAGGLLTYR